MVNLILARLPDLLAFAFVAEWAIRLTRWFYRNRINRKG